MITKKSQKNIQYYKGKSITIIIFFNNILTASARNDNKMITKKEPKM